MITITATVNVPVEKAWQCWTKPEHIIHWNNASADWHTTHAEVELRAGGKFLSRMEARKGSMGFDFSGVYDEVKIHELIACTLDDGRKLTISFKTEGNATKVMEIFEAESENPLELQQSGWQAILDNFKKYTERN